MGKLGTMLQAARSFGARDGMLRLEYELQRGSGLMARRMRSVAGWDFWKLSAISNAGSGAALIDARRRNNPPFFFQDALLLGDTLRKVLGKSGEEKALAEANKIIEGGLPFFGKLNFDTGFPPRWFQNPATGQRVSPSRPWTKMRFADPEYGDLKFILEPSRFLFVYPLARAYAISGEERFAEAFWSSLSDWAEKNPPMSGPLWICGQESSLRIMAWTFALHAFLHAKATTPQRVELLFSMVAAHAWRASQTLDYARSQRSNHLVSEAVGLWTAGTLYPELRDAQHWKQQGRDLLAEAVIDQITPAGALFQNSFNYQRMVLQQILWVIRLDELNSHDLDPSVRQRAAAALAFLEQFLDNRSGHLPNHGSNDGSYILPLAQCEFADYRPLFALGRAVLGLSKRLPDGPWDEAALWTGEGKSKTAADDADVVNYQPAAEGAITGFHRLGSRDSWALVRAGHYSRRPFQADQLHVDLWLRGVNFARDPGTYLYNGDAPWDNGFAGTRVHNTVTVDSKDQMRRAGRFLWLDWAQASGKSWSTSSVPADAPVRNMFEGSHDGYQKLGVLHRRRVQFVAEDGWLIVDDILGLGVHDLQLHWLLPDFGFEIVSQLPLSLRLATGDQLFNFNVFSSAAGTSSIFRAGRNLQQTPSGLPDRPQIYGYESPTYGELCPALSILHNVRAKLPVRMVTAIVAGDGLHLESKGPVLRFTRQGADICSVNINPEQSNGRAS